MTSAKREPIGLTRVWGGASSAVEGQNSWSGDQREKTAEDESVFVL